MADKLQGSGRQKPNPPANGLKSILLWQWGALCIIAGALANQLGGMMSTAPANTAAARGEAFGRGVASLIFIVAGIVLIIMHFTRRKRD